MHTIERHMALGDTCEEVFGAIQNVDVLNGYKLPAPTEVQDGPLLLRQRDSEYPNRC